MNWSRTIVEFFCKLEIKDLRKLKWIQHFYFWAKLKFDMLSQKCTLYHIFIVTASIQNLCGLFEMKE